MNAGLEDNLSFYHLPNYIMTEFIVDAKPTQSTREVLPAGSYMATLFGIVDL
jgi:hypothetical protein